MKLSSYFENVTSGNYTHTENKGSWKIKNNVMYFECSNGEDDWKKNLDILPAIIFIRGVPILTQRGWARVWKDLKPIVDAHPEVTRFVGYSHGCVPATFSAWMTGKTAICFGSPNIAVITTLMKKTFIPVWYVSTDRDIVMHSPPWLGKYGADQTLPYVDMPDYFEMEDVAKWMTGHTQEEYKLAIKLSEAIYDSDLQAD